MNTELLLKVKAKILAEPKQFFMHEFFTDHVVGIDTIPNCGTAACIAGWAVTIARNENPEETRKYLYQSPNNLCTWLEAQKALDITKEQESKLFYTDNWPSEYDAAYNQAWQDEDFEEAAKVAANRIDYFIAHGV